MTQIQLLTTSGVNLKAFVPILGQIPVNKVDSQALRPLAKFGELVDTVLNLACSESHVYATFYVALPSNVEMMFRNYEHYGEIKINCVSEGYGFIAIMSASFTVWRDFIQYLMNDESLRNIGNAFQSFFDIIT